MKRCAFFCCFSFLFIGMFFSMKGQGADPDANQRILMDLQQKGKSELELANKLQQELESRSFLDFVKEPMETLEQQIQKLVGLAQEAQSRSTELDFLRYQKVMMEGANSRAISALARTKILLLRHNDFPPELQKFFEDIKSQQVECKHILADFPVIPHREIEVLPFFDFRVPGNHLDTAFGTSNFRLVSASEIKSNRVLGAIGVLMKPQENGEEGYRHFCSGLQISPRHVLTAGLLSGGWSN